MTGFFFSKQETSSQKRPNGKTLSCFSCGLYKNAKSPKMKPYGKGNKGIMIIGDYPDSHDDESGMPFQGKSGKLLKMALSKHDVDLYEDCISLNAINCHPSTKEGDDRKASQHEVDCCRRIVLSAIKQHTPNVIILLGLTAVNSIIGHRWKDSLETIHKWRGFTIPDQDLKCFVCPVMHPRNVLVYEKNAAVRKIFENDIEQALLLCEQEFPVFKEPEIVVLKKDLTVLNDIPQMSTIAIDYETTSLKPHAKGHRIISASVAVSPEKVYVFMMPRKAEQRRPFVELLKNKTIKKMAHNMKFEHTWSKVILKTTVKNWFWDSMLAAHVLDNRPGITGLKFQVFVNFGIVDYSSNVSKYLIANEANEKNKLEEYVQTEKNAQELLKYNALDSAYEYRLALMQQSIMSNILPF